MKAKLYKIKEGKLERWKTWGSLLMKQYYTEAVETLEEEGILAEYFYTFKIKGEWYSLGGDIEGLTRGKINKKRKLNQKHRQIKRECLEPLGEAECVYLITNL